MIQQIKTLLMKARITTMINSLEKVDIGNGPYHSTLTEHEIQVLRDFFMIRTCIFIISESVSILLNKDNNND